MTTIEHTRVAVVAEERLVRIVQVAYSVEELATVTGLHPDALRRRIQSGRLRARHTGRRYIVTSPAAKAAGLWNAHTLADYRDVIDQDVEYTVREVCTFLALSVYAARRLVRANRLKIVAGASVYMKIRGADLLEYLDGCDAPMQHPESA